MSSWLASSPKRRPLDVVKLSVWMVSSSLSMLRNLKGDFCQEGVISHEILVIRMVWMLFQDAKVELFLVNCRYTTTVWNVIGSTHHDTNSIYSYNRSFKLHPCPVIISIMNNF